MAEPCFLLDYVYIACDYRVILCTAYLPGIVLPLFVHHIKMCYYLNTIFLLYGWGVVDP